MFVLENGDKLQGDASAATVVDYHISGITGGTTLKNLADGQLAATIGDLYTSASTDAATTITLVNTDSVARTVNLYHTPSGGTARRVIPKDLSLSAGYSVVIDGGDIKIIGTDGKLQTTAALGASEIKTLYESNSDTNAFTDAEKTLLGNQSGTNTGDEPSASDTASGIVELATIAEVDTGTDTARAITPAGLAGSALQTKLDGIEALADVTDATNVNAAGATMNTDADVSGNTWVVDEDDLTSDSATKVPTQQSVKAYTDSGTQTLTNKTINTASNTITIAGADVGSGTIAHERGGLEADVSAYSGLVKITGGATSAVDDLHDTATTKGDLLVRGASALGRVAVGSNDQMLVADSAEDSGIKWADTPSESFVIACSDETTDIAVATGVVTFRMPYAFTVTEVRASATTAPTGATITVDINESGSTILSTKLTIDATEKTSETAATAAVISDSALADDAEITIDIDQVGSTLAGAGLKVYIIGKQA